MNSQYPSLLTRDTQSGLTLAGQLADRLHQQIERSAESVERPGGTNYRATAPVSREVIAGILFYAIAAANEGWSGAPSVTHGELRA